MRERCAMTRSSSAMPPSAPQDLHRRRFPITARKREAERQGRNRGERHPHGRSARRAAQVPPERAHYNCDNRQDQLAMNGERREDDKPGTTDPDERQGKRQHTARSRQKRAHRGQTRDDRFNTAQRVTLRTALHLHFGARALKSRRSDVGAKPCVLRAPSGRAPAWRRAPPAASRRRGGPTSRCAASGGPDRRPLRRPRRTAGQRSRT